MDKQVSAADATRLRRLYKVRSATQLWYTLTKKEFLFLCFISQNESKAREQEANSWVTFQARWDAAVREEEARLGPPRASMLE